MKTVFISDLHLDEERPESITLLTRFLQTHQDDVSALYVLGDLFEVWIGDDYQTPLHNTIAKAFNGLPYPVYYLHGNRDFFIGDAFLKKSNLALLADETVIDLNGIPTLLMHGDTLCTDDKAYCRYRKMVRQPFVQKLFLSLPLSVRLKISKKARLKSRAYQATLSDKIMDVNQDAVVMTMKKHKVLQLIHGHTHRPDLHAFDIGGVQARRFVLSDWHASATILVVEPAQSPALIHISCDDI